MTRTRMPQPKPGLHFNNAAGQWRRRVAAAVSAPLKIFSPYITGKQALHLARGRDQTEVYTLFEAELFASRASALSEVKALLMTGVDVYRLPDLHAKILWIPGHFLSVGSQNLTSQGMRNKEATAIIAHEPWMTQVETALDRWIQQRQRITLEMVAHMESEIIPLRAEFKKLRSKFLGIDEAVRAAERQRQQLRAEKNKRLRRKGNDQNVRLSAFRQSFERLHASSEIAATVRKYDGGRVSLVAAARTSFLRWEIDGEAVNLERMKRYLCVVPELGRLGWARVSNGFISFVARSLVTESTKFLGERCKVEWSAYHDEEVDECNLTFEISAHPALPNSKLRLWVDADQVKLVDSGSVDNEIRARWDEVSVEIARHLTRPFKYEHNLTGDSADEFFYAEVDSEFRVRVARLTGHLILVAEAVDRS